MSERDPHILIDDMNIAMERIGRYCEGMTREQFLADDRTVDAVVRNIEIIGEAARQMPSDFISRHASLPWHQMAGMRNRIVHDYSGIDIEIIWQIVVESLPLLRMQLDALRNQ